MINIFGADHSGYIARMKAAVKAVTNEKANLEIKTCQLVRLSRGGKPIKMSKRAGSFITLKEIVNEVGKDAVRFMMVSRKNDAQLDFDFEVFKNENNAFAPRIEPPIPTTIIFFFFLKTLTNFFE